MYYEDENEIKEKIYQGKKYITCFMDISTYGYTRNTTQPNGKTTWALLSYKNHIARKPKNKKRRKEKNCANKEYRNAQNRKWHMENREVHLLQALNWKAHNKDAVKTMRKRYYQKKKKEKEEIFP